MRIERLLTDDAVLAEIGSRVERTRLERNWTQRHLAEQAGISTSTLKRLESGGGSALVNLIRVMRALGLIEELERAIPVPAPSPIERLKLSGRERRRASGGASGSQTPPASAGEWQWGDEGGS